MKALLWRAVAERDAAEAAFWYAKQGGLILGEEFFAEVEAALAHIAAHPGIGAARHANYAPDLPLPLRYLAVKRFERYLIYYVEMPTHVDVVRVWNTARGLDALMSDVTE
ncbi:MAG: type II toxin-antitoxin system RelE/ParE family toxin [Pseudomonadota bacterium]